MLGQLGMLCIPSSVAFLPEGHFYHILFMMHTVLPRGDIFLPLMDREALKTQMVKENRFLSGTLSTV